jgi:hypothetical protein
MQEVDKDHFDEFSDLSKKLVKILLMNDIGITELIDFIEVKIAYG